MRNLIETLSAFCMGVFSFIIYTPFTKFIFSHTYKYTNIIFESLKNIPCKEDPCRLRLFISLLVFVIRDTLFALPVIFVFGLFLGLIIKNFRLSRPLILCLGFFSAQYCYNFINAIVDDFPLYVEIARALPIIFLFIYFAKLGLLIKQKRRFRKIAKENELEEE